MQVSTRILSLTSCALAACFAPLDVQAQSMGRSGAVMNNVQSMHGGGMQQRGKPIPSWYLALGASVNFVQDASVTETRIGTGLNGEMEFNEGYGLTGAIGYRPRNTNSMLDNLRFEAEMGYRDNDMGTYSDALLGINTIDDGMQVQTFMANMFVDLGDGPWRPYLGGGLGMARVFLESNGLGIDDTDMVFAYQGMAGIYYTVPSMPVVELGLGYRYLGTTDPQFTSNRNSQVEFEYDAHIVEAGARFYF